MSNYYSTDWEYQIGDVLQKGRWRKSIDKNHPYFELEQYLEKIRINEILSPVSRLDCFYAFPTKEGIEGYHLGNNKRFIYEVEPVNKDCNYHYTNYEVYSFLRTLPFNELKNQEHAMSLYWLNDETFYSPLTRSVRHIPEILFGCDVRVIKIL